MRCFDCPLFRAELDLIRSERDSLLMSEANMSKELSEGRGALSAVKAEVVETLAKLVKAAEGEKMISIKLEGCKKELEGALAELKGCKKELEGALRDKDDMSLKLEGCKKELEGALTELVSCKIEASELEGKLSLCRNEVDEVGEQLSMTLKEVVYLRS
jgi:chromosome segregation ATPase